MKDLVSIDEDGGVVVDEGEEGAAQGGGAGREDGLGLAGAGDGEGEEKE